MSGKSEKNIRRAVNLMLAGVTFKPGQEESTRRVFVRKTKQVHRQNPGLVGHYLAPRESTSPLEFKVQAAVIAGQNAIMTSAVNRRAKSQRMFSSLKG